MVQSLSRISSVLSIYNSSNNDDDDDDNEKR